jgi:membrane protease YdiL (CAAX protease family)
VGDLVFDILAYFPVLPLAYAFSPVTFTRRFWHLTRGTWIWVIALAGLQSLGFWLGRPVPAVSKAFAFGAIVIVPPVEETVRAVMIRALVRRWGPGWGVGATVALLALVHPDPLGVVVLQLALSIMFLSTESIPSTAIAHAAMNAVSAIGGISQA